MTATNTFDVFTSLDGFGAASASWTGYWGKQGPELLDHRLAMMRWSSGWSSGHHLSGIQGDAGIEHR